VDLPDDAPPAFVAAVASLMAVRPRPEVSLRPIRAPQRLAPWSFALSAQVAGLGPQRSLAGGSSHPRDNGEEPEELATGRLILLHDPDGEVSWAGTFRIVSYVSAALDPEMAGDPLLAAVGWSWLLEALEACGARHTAAGGTVTATSSTRFGDLAGPPSTADVELRASWTPLDDDLGPHLSAWCELLSSTAGLPPPGVALLTPR